MNLDNLFVRSCNLCGIATLQPDICPACEEHMEIAERALFFMQHSNIPHMHDVFQASRINTPKKSDS